MRVVVWMKIIFITFVNDYATMKLKCDNKENNKERATKIRNNFRNVETYCRTEKSDVQVISQ